MELAIQRPSDDETKTRSDDCYIAELMVNGCQVTVRFDAVGDKDVMTSIHSILASAN